jgi:hypothetical protein
VIVRGIERFNIFPDNQGYKGKDVARKLHLGPTRVSIAVRREEKIILHAPEI